MHLRPIKMQHRVGSFGNKIDTALFMRYARLAHKLLHYFCVLNQIKAVVRLEAAMKYLDSRLYVFAMVLACVLASATLFSGYSQNTRDIEDYAMAEPFSSANYQLHHTW